MIKKSLVPEPKIPFISTKDKNQGCNRNKDKHHIVNPRNYRA